MTHERKLKLKNYQGHSSSWIKSSMTVRIIKAKVLGIQRLFHQLYYMSKKILHCKNIQLFISKQL